MKILVINGPNLGLLGIREPEIYGHDTYSDLCDFIKKSADEMGDTVTVVQSNCEGRIVDYIQESYGKYDGIVINAGAEMLVVISGEIMRMPGLPKKPQALNIDIVNGEIEGLS